MLFFCFNENATTEIYTYCHTLSLHGALPILRFGKGWPSCRLDLAAARYLAHAQRKRRTASAEPEIKPAPQHRDRHQIEQRPDDLERQSAIIAEMERLRQIHRAHRQRPGRSEEHTSELPSLMSISYADFCM